MFSDDGEVGRVDSDLFDIGAVEDVDLVVFCCSVNAVLDVSEGVVYGPVPWSCGVVGVDIVRGGDFGGVRREKIGWALVGDGRDR